MVSPSVALRIGGGFAILVAGTLGIALPMCLAAANDARAVPLLQLLKAYAAGVVLALALVHLLNDAYSDLSALPEGTLYNDFPICGVFVCVGVLVMFLSERLSMDYMTGDDQADLELSFRSTHSVDVEQPAALAVGEGEAEASQLPRGSHVHSHEHLTPITAAREIIGSVRYEPPVRKAAAAPAAVPPAGQQALSPQGAGAVRAQPDSAAVQQPPQPPPPQQQPPQPPPPPPPQQQQLSPPEQQPQQPQEQQQQVGAPRKQGHSHGSLVGFGGALPPPKRQSAQAAIPPSPSRGGNRPSHSASGHGHSHSHGHGHGHGHSHGHVHALPVLAGNGEGVAEGLSGSEARRRVLIARLLEFSIVVHSMVIGLNLGTTSGLHHHGGGEYVHEEAAESPAPGPAAAVAQEAPTSLRPIVVLIIVLCFHQMFEGIALGSYIAELRDAAPLRAKLIMIAVFVLTVPSGTWIGIGIASSYDAESVTALWVTGALNAVTGGMLLYNSLITFLAEEFSRDDLGGGAKGRALKQQMYAAVLLGAACMALLGIWA